MNSHPTGKAIALRNDGGIKSPPSHRLRVDEIDSGLSWLATEELTTTIFYNTARRISISSP